MSSKLTTATDSTGVICSYFAAMQAKANQAAASQGPIQIAPIEFGTQGDFNYIWQDVNGNFNQDTFNYISLRVAPGQYGGLELTAPFPNDYLTVVQDLTFKYSIADSKTLSAVATKTEVEATAVVSTYEENNGPITPAQLAAAGVTEKINYVIDYMVAQVWSGTLAAHQPPLQLANVNIENLRSLLPDLPASGEPVMGPVGKWMELVGSTLSLQQASSNAQNVISSLVTNTSTPTVPSGTSTASNGGMTTIDDGGNLTVEVGYTINKAVSDIQNDLSNQKNSFDIDMTIEQVDENTVSVSVESGGSVEVPIDEILGLTVSGGSEQNLFSFDGAGQSAQVTISYSGCSLVPMGPVNWNQATDTGWYYTTPIAQAVANQGQDVTGYQFSPTPQFNFGAGGDFGILTGLLISNYPTVTIKYSQGTYEDFEASFNQQSNWDLSLFGLFKIGGFKESLYEAELSQDNQSGSFTVKFTPSPQVLSVPALQETAYVIGGGVDYPGTHS